MALKLKKLVSTLLVAGLVGGVGMAAQLTGENSVDGATATANSYSSHAAADVLLANGVVYKPSRSIVVADVTRIDSDSLAEINQKLASAYHSGTILANVRFAAKLPANANSAEIDRLLKVRDPVTNQSAQYSAFVVTGADQAPSSDVSELVNSGQFRPLTHLRIDAGKPDATINQAVFGAVGPLASRVTSFEARGDIGLEGVKFLSQASNLKSVGFTIGNEFAAENARKAIQGNKNLNSLYISFTSPNAGFLSKFVLEDVPSSLTNLRLHVESKLTSNQSNALTDSVNNLLGNRDGNLESFSVSGLSVTNEEQMRRVVLGNPQAFDKDAHVRVNDYLLSKSSNGQRASIDSPNARTFDIYNNDKNEIFAQQGVAINKGSANSNALEASDYDHSDDAIILRGSDTSSASFN